MKKINGWICDNVLCRKFFSWEPLIVVGKKRDLHFCSLKCKGTYLKKISKIGIKLNQRKNDEL